MRNFVSRKAVLGVCVALASVTGQAQQAVTTTGGTKGYIPKYTGSATVANSLIFDTGTTVGIGVGATPNSAVKLDIGGGMIVRGNTIVSRSGNATSSQAYPSWGFEFFANAYNSSTKTTVNPSFVLRSEPTANNTGSPSATFNLLFSNNGTPAETGLYINPNGTIQFAPSQTFPIAAGPQGAQGPPGPKGATGATGATGPAGGGLAAVSHDGNLTGSGTAASPLALAGDISVTGQVRAGTGVYGATTGGVAIYGDDSNSGYAVYGGSVSGIGVVAEGGSNIGLFASGNLYAGEFSGNVVVNGTLSKSSGSFKIDHPLDPANKYLSHSFVESPDMMNIYNGNVLTDGHGEAVVEMPNYFEALNRDFRYQLTTIGSFSRAMVASEIRDGKFVIRTEEGNVRVSWQVTGVRQDAWANAHRIPVEEDKPEKEKGHFTHPELFGHKGEPSIAEMGHPQSQRPDARASATAQK